MKQTKKIAEDLFGKSYTIERRLFADGDKRTVIKHTAGWSPTNYIQAIVWVEKGEVWVEYHEDDVCRSKEIMDYDEFNPEKELITYIW
jgi:hypothetical protein